MISVVRPSSDFGGIEAMDRDEALKLLKGGPEGIAEWNRRRDSGEEIPHLNGVQLSGAHLNSGDLRGVDLSDADLRGAYLIRAHLNRAALRGVDLSYADLRGAYLSDADLRGAYLSGAYLRHAYVNSADLRGVDLSDADLREAYFHGADLSDARCLGTVFANIDLSQVNGLEAIRHDGPSTVGIDTLFASKGKIPEVFLRGCGVREALIKYLPSLIGSMDPIQFYSCFISYSSKNRDFAERLHADLQAKGVRCWFDQEDLKIGERFRQRIDTAIRVHDKLMLVLTEHSLASDWVESEVEAALDREGREKRIVLFPIRLDEAVLESPVAWASHVKRTRHIGDFCGWKDHDSYQRAFDRLLRDLRASEESK
jgi:hypothetical protein